MPKMQMERLVRNIACTKEHRGSAQHILLSRLRDIPVASHCINQQLQLIGSGDELFTHYRHGHIDTFRHALPIHFERHNRLVLLLHIPGKLTRQLWRGRPSENNRFMTRLGRVGDCT